MISPTSPDPRHIPDEAGSPPASLPESAEVLVVGYGPVGATIGCLLGRYGVRTVIIDKAEGILMLPRAIALDDEGQRILQMAGLADDAFEKLAIRECRLLSPWFGEFARVGTSGVEGGFARLVTFYQPDMEKALRRALETHATVTTVEGAELLDLDEDTDGVTARIRSRDGRETALRARYVIGADGAASIVRRLIGQDFPGKSYCEDWLIVDSEGHDERREHIDFHCHYDGARPHAPAPGGRQRWEFMLGPDQSPERMDSDEGLRRLLAPWGDPGRMRIERRAVYRFHARCCESFQRGRIFLAGDAAHITPPFAGQGLMSGLRDAANLCWKLKWVLDGRARPDLLDSYDMERRPHARAMIELARTMGRLIMPVHPIKTFLLHGSMRLMRMLGPVRRYLEEMRLKPAPGFREGLMAPGRARMQRGSWLVQSLVRDGQGETRLSDDVFGNGLTLVGFGADSRRHVDADLRDAWIAAGGGFFEVTMRSQRPEGDGESCEDMTGALVPGAAPPGWAAVVRPDRNILHDGPATDAARLIRGSLDILGRSAAAANEPGHPAAHAA